MIGRCYQGCFICLSIWIFKSDDLESDFCFSDTASASSFHPTVFGFVEIGFRSDDLTDIKLKGHVIVVVQWVSAGATRRFKISCRNVGWIGFRAGYKSFIKAMVKV